MFMESLFIKEKSKRSLNRVESGHKRIEKYIDF